MLLPPGQILHKDLRTSYTDFEKLLLELRENRFNGYLRLSFWGYEGIFILDVGRIIQAYSTEKENFLLGESAIVRIMEKASEKEGSIDVHALSNEVAITLASVLGSTLYQTQENVSHEELQKIIDELDAKSLTGYLDIQLGSKKGLGTIYFLEGLPIESVIMSTTGRIVSGEIVFSKLIEFSKLIQSTIRIFWNNQVEHIQETKVMLIPDLNTPALEYWNVLLNTLRQEINRVLKKTDFLEMWQIVKNEYSANFPFLDPIGGYIEWKNNRFVVHNLILISDFYHGMVQSLTHTIQQIPSRRRGKIKVGKIIQEVNSQISNLPPESGTPDTLTLIKEIFQEYK